MNADFSITSDAEDAVGIANAESGNAVKHELLGAIEINGKELAITNSPGELGVEIKVKIGEVIRDNFGGFKTVKTHEPIRLVKPVFANKRRRSERKNGRGLRDRAEGGVVNTAETIV